MPGISQPFPNIFDPLNLLGNTGASNTKIRYILLCVEHCYLQSRPPTVLARADRVFRYCLGVAMHGFSTIFNRLCRELRRWREAEVTHGRVSMLAALGFIVQVQAEYFSS